MAPQESSSSPFGCIIDLDDFYFDIPIWNIKTKSTNAPSTDLWSVYNRGYSINS